MRPGIDPPVMDALLGRRPDRRRRRWRPCWIRISLLAGTLGFWWLVGSAIAGFLASRS